MANNPIGTVTNPLKTLNSSTPYESVRNLPNFITNLIRLITIGAGLFAMINFVIAGLTYISANGDEKKLEQAIATINLSIIGLVVVVASFVLTGIVSYLVFGDAKTILNPVIYGPGSID